MHQIRYSLDADKKGMNPRVPNYLPPAVAVASGPVFFYLSDYKYSRELKFDALPQSANSRIWRMGVRDLIREIPEYLIVE